MKSQNANEVEPIAADALYRKIYLRFIPFLLICYIVALIDRVNIGLAKLNLSKDIGLTDAQFGLAVGLFSAGYLLFEIPSNFMMAKIGIRKTLLRIMVIWGVCSTASAIVSGAQGLYVLRFLLGAAEAGFFPGVLLFIAYWVPASRRARFTALFAMGLAFSGIIGGLLTASLIHGFDGIWGFAGWQWMFLLEGLPAILLGAFAFWWLDDQPEDAGWLKDRERAFVRAELETARGDASTRPSGFGALFKDVRFYLLCGMSAALQPSIAAVFYWQPTIIRNSGVRSVLAIGFLSALPFAVGAICQFLVARSSDRTMERRWHIILPMLVAGFGWAVMPLVPDQPFLSIIMLSVAMGGMLGATGPFWSLPAGMFSGAALAGGLAAVATAGQIGSMVAPILFGWVATVTGSLAYGQVAFAVLIVVGSVLIYALPKSYPAVRPGASVAA